MFSARKSWNGRLGGRSKRYLNETDLTDLESRRIVEKWCDDSYKKINGLSETLPVEYRNAYDTIILDQSIMGSSPMSRFEKQFSTKSSKTEEKAWEKILEEAIVKCWPSLKPMEARCDLPDIEQNELIFERATQFYQKLRDGQKICAENSLKALVETGDASLRVVLCVLARGGTRCSAARLHSYSLLILNAARALTRSSTSTDDSNLSPNETRRRHMDAARSRLRETLINYIDLEVKPKAVSSTWLEPCKLFLGGDRDVENHSSNFFLACLSSCLGVSTMRTPHMSDNVPNGQIMFLDSARNGKLPRSLEEMWKNQNFGASYQRFSPHPDRALAESELCEKRLIWKCQPNFPKTIANKAIDPSDENKSNRMRFVPYLEQFASYFSMDFLLPMLFAQLIKEDSGSLSDLQIVFRDMKDTDDFEIPQDLDDARFWLHDEEDYELIVENACMVLHHIGGILKPSLSRFECQKCFEMRRMILPLHTCRFIMITMFKKCNVSHMTGNPQGEVRREHATCSSCLIKAIQNNELNCPICGELLKDIAVTEEQLKSVFPHLFGEHIPDWSASFKSIQDWIGWESTLSATDMVAMAASLVNARVFDYPIDHYTPKVLASSFGILLRCHALINNDHIEIGELANVVDGLIEKVITSRESGLSEFKLIAYTQALLSVQSAMKANERIPKSLAKSVDIAYSLLKDSYIHEQEASYQESMLKISPEILNGFIKSVEEAPPMLQQAYADALKCADRIKLFSELPGLMAGELDFEVINEVQRFSRTMVSMKGVADPHQLPGLLNSLIELCFCNQYPLDLVVRILRSERDLRDEFDSEFVNINKKWFYYSAGIWLLIASFSPNEQNPAVECIFKEASRERNAKHVGAFYQQAITAFQLCMSSKDSVVEEMATLVKKAADACVLAAQRNAKVENGICTDQSFARDIRYIIPWNLINDQDTKRRIWGENGTDVFDECFKRRTEKPILRVAASQRGINLEIARIENKKRNSAIQIQKVVRGFLSKRRVAAMRLRNEQ